MTSPGGGRPPHARRSRASSARAWPSSNASFGAGSRTWTRPRPRALRSARACEVEPCEVEPHAGSIGPQLGDLLAQRLDLHHPRPGQPRVDGLARAALDTSQVAALVLRRALVQAIAALLQMPLQHAHALVAETEQPLADLIALFQRQLRIAQTRREDSHVVARGRRQGSSESHGEHRENAKHLHRIARNARRRSARDLRGVHLDRIGLAWSEDRSKWRLSISQSNAP